MCVERNDRRTGQSWEMLDIFGGGAVGALECRTGAWMGDKRGGLKGSREPCCRRLELPRRGRCHLDVQHLHFYFMILPNAILTRIISVGLWF